MALDTGNEDTRRYSLPAEYQAIFLDPHSLAHMAPLPGFVVSFASVLPRLIDAYRKGEGIGYGDYGLDMRDSQGAFNRPHYEQFLADWIATLPDVKAKIDSGAEVNVADIGCGVGWSSIQFGLNWPNVVVLGIDSDPASIERARINADEAGVADRVRFVGTDASASDGFYDLVTAFECVHDMSQPVDALAAMRKISAGQGTVLIMDEKADDTPTPTEDLVQRLLASASVLHCLPAGRAEAPSAATGTLLTRATMERYAFEAGFSEVTVLPIEHDVFRFYRLEP